MKFFVAVLNYTADPDGCAVRRGSKAVRLLGLRIRIPPGAWMPVSCECCLLWVRGLCDGPRVVQRSPTECSVSHWVWSRNLIGNA